MHRNTYPLRFIFVFLLFILCLVAFSVKLVLIQVFRSDYLTDLAEKQHNYFIKLEPRRGTIYDRNLRPLAINVTVFSLYANPKIMSQQDKSDAVRQLPAILDKDQSFFKERLDKDKYFVWLSRKISPELVQQIKTLGINGLDFVKESRRSYPNHWLAAHVIGFAGIDNQGLEGLELLYDDQLKGEFGWAHILRDARQRELLIEKEFIPPRDGFDLVLTIDETIQYIAERALDKAFTKNNAKGATIIVMVPGTGEILALANRPTFNLDQITHSSTESRTNRAVAYTYEPGSVFKIVTASAALQEDIAKEEDKFFCENGEYRIGNHILRDHTPHGTLTFRQVFEQSSNICVSKIAQKLGPNRVYQYAKQFQFGKETKIDLPGEVGGMLKPPSKWSKTSIGAIPMGQEVTVTPIQLAAAIAAIANDGVYMKPFVVKYIKDSYDQVIKEFHPTVVNTVITPEIAARVQDILTGVVENGTGRKAKIKGMRVAGKTGTAQKVIDGSYSHSKFYASFIGFAPTDDAKVAVVVVFDEPHPSYFGGTVAAPVFQEVVQDVLKYLNLPSSHAKGF